MRQDFIRIGGVFREHPLGAEKVRCHSERCLLLLLFLFPLMCMIQLCITLRKDIARPQNASTQTIWGEGPFWGALCVSQIFAMCYRLWISLRTLWKMCTRSMQSAAKYILCSVAAVQQFRQSCVIAKCSAEKPYFSHMSNDAVGCGWGGRSPLAIWAQIAQTGDTKVQYTCRIH